MHAQALAAAAAAAVAAVAEPAAAAALLIDRGDCFLGGRMHFTKPPSGIGMPWRLDLIVDMWAADILITLDFKGDAAELRAFLLQIGAAEGALWQDAITAHSVTTARAPSKATR